MFSRPGINCWKATLGLVTLTVTMLVLACGQGTVTNDLTVSDDTSFRRAMLKSSAVFAYETPEYALEHWTDLWTVSGGLDCRTRSARRDLLVSAVEPLLDKASGPESLQAIERIRDRLEEKLEAPRDARVECSDARCDWIVLNRLLGDNERTISWMMRRCRMASMSRLPKRVREFASLELAGEVEWDDNCNCPVYLGSDQSIEL